MIKYLLVLYVCFFNITLFSVTSLPNQTNTQSNDHPKLTVVIVIDQFSVHYYQKLKQYLKGGIKFLYENGTYYSNAWYPHSQPGTAAGHTLLGTGTVGNYHGIISNWWYENGKKVFSDGDTAEYGGVFAPDGLYPYGKSPRNCKVDGLSDNIIMYSIPHTDSNVWSISHKSRAAIGMASRFGKAIWFDNHSGNFTSCKVYFNELPDWLKKFNEKQGIFKLTKFPWKLAYPTNSPAYRFKFHHNYTYCARESAINCTEVLDKSKKHAYEPYSRTPASNKLLLELGKTVINENFKGTNKERFVLWMSLSGLDKIGHAYGPFSTEAIDMLYHMDRDIQEFINFVYTKADPKDVLFVLTGDHGSHPIVDILKDAKLDLARRVSPTKMRDDMNIFIEKKYGIKGLVQYFNEQQYYLDQSALKKVDKKTNKKILNDIKEFLERQPGIRKAWTFEELQNTQFDKFDLDVAWKHQLFKGRSGDLIFSIFPYTNADKHPKGTGHQTPYAYDAQVPLILHWPKHTEKKLIAENVYMTQVAPTLAQLLKVPRPSACNSNVLPGINYK